MAECRLRRPERGPYSPVPTNAAAVPSREQVTWTSFVPGAVFLIAMLTYVGTGLFCIAIPPQATDAFDDHVIPSTASCVRVTRHTSYASVDLAIGAPPSLLNLLLRMDLVKTQNQTAVRLFSKRVAESAAVACTGTVCTDVALMHRTGPSSPQEKVVVQFEYTNPTTESLNYGTAVTMGLDGEFTLKQGYDYYLTTTHLCWSIADATGVHSGAEPTPGENEGAVPARIVAGTLRTDATGLQQTSTMRATPAGMAQSNGYCSTGVGEVRLFPGAAADEATFLGLASKRAYETSPEGVDGRRAVVEVGELCAANHSSYTRAYSLYQLDCLSVYVNCDNYPSVPYRRVAADQLRLHVPDDGSDLVYVFTHPDARLGALPKLEEGGHAMYLSFVKLSLMTLAAAVTWIRAKKSTASMDRLFIYCLRMAHCPVLNHNSLEGTAVYEDALIGLLALGARLGVSIWRVLTLAVDGQLRAPMAQLIASVLSLAQWYVRYRVLDRVCETPLTKLGGSTALVDATCAVMMGFAEPPLLVSAIGRFDPTARLLTALLVSTMTLQRCLFATSCCGLLWTVASDDVSKSLRSADLPGAQPTSSGFQAAYVPIIFGGLVAWLLQTASVAILLADVFCVPLAHSMARSVPGGWVEIAMALFVATSASGLPAMMLTLQSIAEHPVTKKSDDAD